jgi:TolC family type I secretion outer membrane protein
MKIRSTHIALLTTVLSLTPAMLWSPDAHAISIKDAMARAYMNNPALHAGQAQLESTSELLPQAYAGFLPSATFGYERGKEKETLGRREDDFQVTTRQLSATQPVFNGFASLSEVSRANNLISAEQYRLTNTEQSTLSDAITAYMDVVRSSEVLDLNKSNVQVLKEQLQATNERFSLGETTRTDVAQSEARLSRAISDETVAEGDLVAAQANYKRVVGEDPVDVSMPKALPAIPNTIADAIGLATDRNPAVLFAKYRADAANNDVNISKSRLLPDASVVVSRQNQDGLANFTGASDQEINSVMLNVHVPLYQSGSEYSRIRQDKRTREQRQLDLEEANNQAVEQVTKNWEAVRTARATIKSTTDAVNAAQVALEGVKQEAAVGSRTVLDILDAEQELFVTRVNLVGAQRNEVIATYNLLASVGSLTAQAMDLNVAKYNPEEYKNKVKYRFIGF